MQIAYSDNMTEQEKRNYIRNSFDNLFVEAGAGAGKTTFISKRIINYIKAGANPADFVFIAFTNEASGELLSKIEKNIRRELGRLSGEEKERLEQALLNLSDMNIMTIYRFCYGLLVDGGVEPQIESETKLLSAKGMDRSNSVLVKQTLELFKRDKDYLKKCRGLYKYIFVDEYQDTNADQTEVIRQLVLKDDESGIRDCSVFFLGDEKQSIYGSEGADVSVFRKVRESMRNMPNAHVVSVENNYRSEIEIINWVNKSFKNVFDNYEPMLGDWIIKKTSTFHGVRRATPVFSYETYDTKADIKATMRLVSHLMFDDKFMIDDKDGGDSRRFALTDFLILLMQDENVPAYEAAARDYGFGDELQIATVKHSKGLSANVVIVADRSLKTGEDAEWRRVEYVEATRPRHALIFMPEIVPDTLFSGPEFEIDKLPEIRA